VVPETPPPPGEAPVPPGKGQRSRRQKVLFAVALVAGAVLLGGCQVPTFGAFRGATVQGKDEFKLWFGMVVASLVVAVIVWGLIFWSIAAYRKKKGDTTMPPQFAHNIPIEIIYTIIPLIIVFVIFAYTVISENEIDAVAKPAELVHVTAYRWGWQFTYETKTGVPQGVTIRTSAEPKLLAQSPKSSQYPQLVLPNGEGTEIVLTSNDVVHAMYVPAFNFSRMALPGVTNRFEFTPTQLGVFDGQCQTYCGLYHSEMLFSVRVVSQADFASWLAQHKTSGATA
jgi:cytochrome c oxidase subunit II